MNILAIESSCDEFAGAIVRDGREILSSVVASQANLHAAYGGVVPELAGREHLRSVTPVLDETFRQAALSWNQIDAIAATQGPGLGGSLLVGINTAKAAAWARRLPCIAVHHIEGHLYANWLATSGPGDGARTATEESEFKPPEFPLVCLVVSGGHTELLLMRGHGDFQRLGQTLDDAAGEAFDKVGRLLGLSFPGGPAIEKAAAQTGPGADADPLPRAWLEGSYDFSFSGLKTAVLHRVRERGSPLPTNEMAALARAFQDAVIDVLSAKTAKAAAEFGVLEVIVAGGVAANGALREALAQRCPVPVRVPPPVLCTDNAAMIGGAAYFKLAPIGTGTIETNAALDWDLFSTSGATVFSPGGR
jgi:N6-L-threonylcarbamoyladenine synthase